MQSGSSSECPWCLESIHRVEELQSAIIVWCSDFIASLGDHQSHPPPPRRSHDSHQEPIISDDYDYNNCDKNDSGGSAIVRESTGLTQILNNLLSPSRQQCHTGHDAGVVCGPTSGCVMACDDKAVKNELTSAMATGSLDVCDPQCYRLASGQTNGSDCQDGFLTSDVIVNSTPIMANHSSSRFSKSIKSGLSKLLHSDDNDQSMHGGSCQISNHRISGHCVPINASMSNSENADCSVLKMQSSVGDVFSLHDSRSGDHSCASNISEHTDREEVVPFLLTSNNGYRRFEKINHLSCDSSPIGGPALQLSENQCASFGNKLHGGEPMLNPLNEDHLIRNAGNHISATVDSLTGDNALCHELEQSSQSGNTFESLQNNLGLHYGFLTGSESSTGICRKFSPSGSVGTSLGPSTETPNFATEIAQRNHAADGNLESLLEVVFRPMAVGQLGLSSRSHHKLKKFYKCPFCEREFKLKCHAIRHGETHTAVKYECTMCGKKFTRADSVKRHFDHAHRYAGILETNVEAAGVIRAASSDESANCERLSQERSSDAGSVLMDYGDIAESCGSQHS